MVALPAAAEPRTLRPMPQRVPEQAVRVAILRELRRGELANEPRPSFVVLARVIGTSETNARYHARALRGLCLLEWVSTRGADTEVRLTPAGRLSADCLLTSGE